MSHKSSISVLFAPIHYVLDRENAGSEISWAFQIYNNISSFKEIKSIFLAGGVRGIKDENVISSHIFNPASLNIFIFNVIKFYISIFIEGRKIIRKNNIHIIHHVLPFGPNSFNILPIFYRKKFIVGPVQPTLEIQDLDVDLSDTYGESSKRHFSFSQLLTEIILKLFKPIFNQLSILTLNKADLIIAVNSQAKQEIINKGISENKIQIIAPGIEAAKFKTSSRNNKKSDFINILVVSFLRERKKIDLILLAIKEISEKHKNFKLIIVGDGPQEKKLKENVVELKLEKFVIFKGRCSQQEIVKYYNQSNVFLNMSQAEGFATICLEAMASGLAVVSSRVGGFQDIIEDGLDGYIIDQGDYIAMSKRIIKLIEDPELISQIGNRAQLKIEKSYDWEKAIIPKYLNIYKNILN